MKSKYITPEITVVEFKVEAGFAESIQIEQGESNSTGLTWSEQSFAIDWNERS